MGGITKFMAIGTKTTNTSLHAFDRRHVSPFIELSADGLSANHNDPNNEAMQGVLFGDAPLAYTAQNSRYFEVRIDQLREGFPDGLVIGVTTSAPGAATGSNVFHCADEVPGSWSFGYDGSSVVVPIKTKEVAAQRRVKIKSEASVHRV